MMIEVRNTITHKNPKDMLHMSYASSILMNYFQKLPAFLPLGIKEKELEVHAVDYLVKNGASPSSKGYKGFPSDVSISKNNIIAHGIPSDDELQSGDMLTLDIVANYMGWHADMSWTYMVDSASDEDKYLINAAWRISHAGLNAVKVGHTLQHVARAILDEAHNLGVHVYNQFVGHGIGRNIHELPLVTHSADAKKIPFSSGMVLCIEPMVSITPQRVIQLPSGEYIGLSKVKTAVFEHMVGIFGGKTHVLSYGMLPPHEMPNEYPRKVA